LKPQNLADANETTTLSDVAEFVVTNPSDRPRHPNDYTKTGTEANEISLGTTQENRRSTQKLDGID